MSEDFFSRIQGYFDERYGGRYLSVILKECLREDPSLVKSIFGPFLLPSSEYTVSLEFNFSGRHGTRFADLAIIDSQRRPLALIEVKHHDEKQPRNHAQLRDYLAYCKATRASFLLLTCRPPSQEDLEAIRAAGKHCRHMLWAGLYSLLAEKTIASPVVPLLRDYLQEVANVFRADIEEDALTLYMIKSLSLQHNHGLGKYAKLARNRIDRAPETLTTIVRNVSVVADDFYQQVGHLHFSRVPAVDFSLSPYLSTGMRSPVEVADTEIGKLHSIKNQAKVGGDLSVWAQSRFKLKSNDWLYLSIGYFAVLDARKGVLKPKGSPLQHYGFAEVTNYGQSVAWCQTPMKLCDEQKCIKTLARCAQRAVKEASADEDLPSRYRIALRSFLKTLLASNLV
jgi:hypothetical protein